VPAPRRLAFLRTRRQLSGVGISGSGGEDNGVTAWRQQSMHQHGGQPSRQQTRIAKQAEKMAAGVVAALAGGRAYLYDIKNIEKKQRQDEGEKAIENALHGAGWRGMGRQPCRKSAYRSKSHMRKYIMARRNGAMA
jgi:hypothetical protein